MLDVAILDNVERLMDKTQPLMLPSLSPMAFQLSGLSFKLIYAGDATEASSLAQALANLGTTWAVSGPVYPSSDFSKVWTGAQSPSYKAMLFDMSTETVTFDDSIGRGLSCIITDSSGVVWASGTVSGYYGLWKRTGAATWTQVLSDTGSAYGILWRASDNTYWFKSYALNYYSLSNGVASLVSAPTGTLVQLGSYGWQNLDAPFITGATFNSVLTVKNADGTSDTTHATPLDMSLNYSGLYSTISVLQIRLDSTYSLLVTKSTNESVPTHYMLYMFNKSSYVIKYIGSFPACSLRTMTSIAQSVYHLAPFAAKWTNDGFRLYLRGCVLVAAAAGYLTTAGTLGGIIAVDVPYQPNF